MMKKLGSRLILTLCLLYLAAFVIQKIDYWWIEKTYAPRHRVADSCRELKRQIEYISKDYGIAVSNDCTQLLLKRGYDSIPLDPWGNKFEARLDKNGELEVWSYGPDGTKETDDDLSNRSALARPHSRRIPWGGGM